MTQSTPVPPTPTGGTSPPDPLKADFRAFLFLVWKSLGLPDPTPVQYNIAQYMQHGPKRRMVKAFRGVGKSWIAAAYVLWRLRNDPQLNILVVSASKQRSDAFTTFCQRLITEIPVLAHLRPRAEQRWSMVSFDVGPAKPSQSPSVMSVGVYGNATGMRADIIIPDDIEVPNNSETITQREKLGERVKEFDAILKPGGEIMYLGTDQTEDSVYRQLPSRGYSVRIWPVRYPDEKQVTAYEGMLAPMIESAVLGDPALVGRSAEPARFTDIDIMQREMSYGRAGFALQFMLDPRLSDADLYPLKLKDLMVFPLDLDLGPERLMWSGAPEHLAAELPTDGMGGDRFYRARELGEKPRFLPWAGTVMHIDPAGRGPDETAYAVVSMLNGIQYVRDVGGLKGYGPDTMTALSEVAKRFKVNLVRVEPNFSDGMFVSLLKPTLARIHPCRVEDAERATSQKEKRIIASLEPVMTAHRLVVDQALVERDYRSTAEMPPEEARQYRLFYQMTRLNGLRGCLKHDDRLDALAGAVSYWTKDMSRDVEKAVEASREKALEAELQKFAKHVSGQEARRPNLAPADHG